jgi:hypothetical protein
VYRALEGNGDANTDGLAWYHEYTIDEIGGLRSGKGHVVDVFLLGIRDWVLCLNDGLH